MSQFAYNNINLSFVKTDSIAREVKWSDDGTTYNWTEFTISLNALYSPAATSYTTTGVSKTAFPPITDSAIRHALMQPRRPLTYTEGGQSIITITSPAGTTADVLDCNNGPIPISCNVTRIASSRLFFVSYSVKCAIIECPFGTVPSEIGSSRYSRSESINDQYFSTLTTNGTTYFRSNVLASVGNNADFYRNYVIPQCLLGYRRTSVSVALSSDGLKLEWSTVDVEQNIDLGNESINGTAGSMGITDMGMTYHVGQLMKSNLGLASFGSIASVSVWAKGQKNVNRFNMVAFILNVAQAKLAAIIPVGILSSCEMTEDVFNNKIQLDMSYTVLDDTAGFPQMSFPITGVVGSPAGNLPVFSIEGKGANPIPTWANGTRGSAAYDLAVSALATACFYNATQNVSDSTGTAQPSNLRDNSPQPGYLTVVKAFWAPPNPGPTQTIRIQASPGQPPGKYMYIRYEVVVNNVTSKGIIQLPKTPLIPGFPIPTDLVTAAIIRLFAPVSRTVVEFAVDRIGSAPDIPDPSVPQFIDGKANPNFGNFTLLSSTISTIGVEVMADGQTLVYRATGTYTYSNNHPQGNNAVVPFPVPPWVNVSSNLGNQINQINYNDKIIGYPA